MKYTYTPIPDGHIRLLKIEPAGSSAAPLRCRTSYHQLHRAPDYTAISYTWGRSPAREAIVCDGVPMTVPVSSAAALRAVRQATRVESVWIDAICINQEDDEERNTQVARMGGIFFGARKTKIWLGAELEEWKAVTESVVVQRPPSQRGPRRKSDLARSSTGGDGKVARGGTRAPSSPDGETPASSVTREMLLSLFQRPWFTRLWVIQELLLSRRVLIIIRHGIEVEWDAIRLLAAEFRLAATSAPRLLGMRAELGRVSSSSGSGSGSGQTLVGAGKLPYDRLPDILALTRDFRCQDPRDKLFAVLSLFSLPLPALIRPDYRKSVTQVYRDLTLFCLGMGHPDSLRNAVGVGGGPGASVAPSWAYDWQSEGAGDGHPSSSTSTAGFSAGRKREIRFKQHGDDALVLRGMILGTVTRVTDLTGDRRATRRASADRARSKSPNPTAPGTSFRCACEVTRSGGKTSPIPAVPRGTQVGDLLCLLIGFPRTFILRRASAGWFQRLSGLRRASDATAGSFRLVGECDYHDDDEEPSDEIDWDSVGVEPCRAPLVDFVIV